MGKGPDHLMTLTAPACPGGKGDTGRWVLHVFHRPTGWRYGLAGPFHDDPATAMAAAAQLLDGFEPEWAEIPTAPGWPAAYRATNPEHHERKP